MEDPRSLMLNPDNILTIVIGAGVPAVILLAGGLFMRWRDKRGQLHGRRNERRRNSKKERRK